MTAAYCGVREPHSDRVVFESEKKADHIVTDAHA